MKKRTLAALTTISLAGAMLAQAATAAPPPCGPGGVGPVVRVALSEVGPPMGGPREQWEWAHPDGKFGTPGQAIVYFCLVLPAEE